MAQKRRVIFTYRARQAQMGSTVMRVHQLAEIFRNHRGDEFEIEVAGIPRPRFKQRHREFVEHAKDAIVIGLKFALDGLGEEYLLRLRESARAICLDHVDSVPKSGTLSYYDAHILASHLGRQKLERRLRNVGASSSTAVHVTHHADPRLPAIQPDTNNAFSICYFGNPKNMAPASGEVEVLPYMEKGFSYCAELLPRYSAHYGVRTRRFSKEVSKPFTKGFTAAAMYNNILVDAGTDDALFYLGPDYPYLLRDREPETVLAGLDHMRSTFNRADWKHGLEIMELVRHLSSYRHISSELVAALDLAEAMAGTR